MQKTTSVEQYIANHPQWRKQLVQLRNLMLDTELEETIKWGAPTYCLAGKNVVGLGAFKSYVGLWFHQGAFLSDPNKVLINAQEGKTQGMRQWRFEADEPLNAEWVAQYINEAIENQRAGKEIKVNKDKPVEVPPQLQKLFGSDPEIKTQFEQMGTGKQREYAEYIASAKRESTKNSRLEKITPMLKQGIGLNDKYRNC